MGKVAGVAQTVGSLFTGPEIPDPPPPPPEPPPPAAMPDPDSALATALARRTAAKSRTSGRQSTIMSDAAGFGGGAVLGV